MTETQTTGTVERQAEDLEKLTETQTTEQTPAEEPKLFDEAYVKKLRDESAKYRQKAVKTEDLQRELFALKVAQTGLLADPTDLPFQEDLLDSDKLQEALQALLEAKPHLASRTPRGSVGQGASEHAEEISLAGMLRARA